MKVNALWCAAALVVGLLTPARGWFVLEDDFEDYVLGPIQGQGEWTSFEDTSAVVVDPDNPSNQVLAVTAVSTRAYRPSMILDGTTRMMFLRFCYGSQINCSFGLSNAANPAQFGDFEVELDLGNAVGELRILDDNNFDVLTSLQSNQWYNLWVLVNNEADETWVYLNSVAGADVASGDRQDNELGEEVFVFRGSTGASLIRFYIKTGGGNSENAGPLYLDDLYFENKPSLSLFNPTTPGPPFFRHVWTTNDTVNLVISNLIPSVNHRLEWTDNLMLPDWNEAKTFLATSESTNWSETATLPEPRSYRVRIEP